MTVRELIDALNVLGHEADDKDIFVLTSNKFGEIEREYVYDIELHPGPDGDLELEIS